MFKSLFRQTELNLELIAKIEKDFSISFELTHCVACTNSNRQMFATGNLVFDRI